MGTVRDFEELDCWQQSRVLVNRIYRITRAGDFANDWGLRDQICRAAVSVMSNIAEGFERNADTQFAQYLNIAKGSLGEVRAQLYIARDQGYIDDATFKSLTDMSVKTGKTIGGLIAYLRGVRPLRRLRPDSEGCIDP